MNETSLISPSVWILGCTVALPVFLCHCPAFIFRPLLFYLSLNLPLSIHLFFILYPFFSFSFVLPSFLSLSIPHTFLFYFHCLSISFSLLNSPSSSVSLLHSMFMSLSLSYPSLLMFLNSSRFYRFTQVGVVMVTTLH